MAKSRTSMKRTSPKARGKTKAKAKAKNVAATRRKSPRRPPLRKNENGVVMLSGGNPQIPKGDGDAPVQAYIANMPEWKRELGRRLDTLIERAVPGVRKAVKWNSPFYGVDGKGWFLAFHVFTRYVKVTFFRGSQLEPRPPGASKDPSTRYYDIHEGEFDERAFEKWVKQAAAIPGWLA